MEGAVAAVDGERDPRCLLLGFQSIRELCCLYAEHIPKGECCRCVLVSFSMS